MLNAPVYFNQPLWNNPGWSYTPSYSLGLGYGYGGYGSGGLFGSMFYGPGYNNYYYGNYYNPWYTGGYGGFGLGFGLGYPFFGYGLGLGLFGGYGYGGYYPWWYNHRGYHNNLWNHYCWLNRNNPNWANHVRANGFAQATGLAARPPVTAAHTAARTMANKPLAITPRGGAVAGVGNAVNSAVRSAAVRTAPQPLIQPSHQVAKSLQTAHANLHPGGTHALSTGASGGLNRGANGGVSPRLGGIGSSPTGALSARTGDSDRAARSCGHSARHPPTVHGTNLSGLGGQPTIHPGGIGGIQGIDRMGGITNMPNHTAPTIRYGSAQGAFPGSPSVIGSGHGGIPSTSMYHPSMMPSYSPGYGSGRGIMISPSGGARFGGGGFGGYSGGHMGSFGGGHMGGGPHGRRRPHGWRRSRRRRSWRRPPVKEFPTSRPSNSAKQRTPAHSSRGSLLSQFQRTPPNHLIGSS